MAKSSGNGGILGSGIFGMFGTVVNCSSTDQSIYCNIMKFFNLIIVAGIILFIISFMYTTFIRQAFISKKR
jgi:hypothetical protein